MFLKPGQRRVVITKRQTQNKLERILWISWQCRDAQTQSVWFVLNILKFCYLGLIFWLCLEGVSINISMSKRPCKHLVYDKPMFKIFTRHIWKKVSHIKNLTKKRLYSLINIGIHFEPYIFKTYFKKNYEKVGVKFKLCFKNLNQFVIY